MEREFKLARAAAVTKSMSDSQRKRAERELPNVKTLICAVFPYFNTNECGNISIYARCADYHDVVRRELVEKCAELAQHYPDSAFKPYADSAVYNEVYACACAGLGVVGKNHLLLTENFGSYVFCGVIATDCDLGGGDAARTCVDCGKCKNACPSGALCGEKLDEAICVSAITQQKGELSALQMQILRSQDKIWGCDACQECCPYNANISQTLDENFLKSLICSISKRDLEGLNNAQFLEKYNARAFTWRGIAPLLRNVTIMEE